MSLFLLGQAMAGSDLGYSNQTTLHPLGLAAVAALGSTLVAGQRHTAVLSVLVMACFVASAQRLVLVGLDFNLLRIMVLFGTARVIVRHEYQGFLWRPVDLLVLVYASVKTVTYTLQQANLQSLVTQLGQSYDTVGMYFLFRCLIREWGDIRSISKGCSWLVFPVAAAFLVEASTGRNMFSVFGGVPAQTLVREGKLRCQGAFGHAILAGCFWAALLPLIASRWWQGGLGRPVAIAGSAAALMIVFFCASSTPVVAVIAAALSAAMFPARHYLRWVRWAVVLTLVALHFSMNKPVWHLIARIDVIGGSTGYHRYKLIDAAIGRFDEWAVAGVATTLHWGPGLHDLTNQYVLEAVRGGLLTLILFVLIMVFAFRDVGRLCRSAGHDRSTLACAWALGVSLCVHASSFIAVSYFGQITVLWYLSLAMPISLAAGLCPATSRGVAISTQGPSVLPVGE